ncbi:MAG TPA: PIG-L family deacetylase [Caproicibacter sp.]|nr:PIG-L family deacetylase [Caproicibacter sp.]
MDRKKLKIMALGGHIGDMELTCGKLLAKHAVMGDSIMTVALTAGERGAPKNYPVADFRSMNVKGAEKFAKKLGGESVVFDYRDGELPDDEKIRFEVCDLMRQFRPDVVITHWKKSMHKDHMTTSRVVNDGLFYASLGTIERELDACCPRGPFYAQNWEDSIDFTPYIYFDVTEGYALWEEAIKNLWLSTNSSFKYLEYYDALSRENGVRIGRQRAEAYAINPEGMHLVYNSLDNLFAPKR